MDRGRAVQEQIVGVEGVAAMRANAPAELAHIQRYLTGNCFGDWVSRDGIDLPTRELLTFSMLISLGGCEPQVAGHVRGNLRVGNTRERLIEVVTQLVPFIGYPRSLNALRVVDEVAPPEEQPA
jgi:4-carboxymuconolactone decarboxylase